MPALPILHAINAVMKKQSATLKTSYAIDIT